MSLLEEFGIDLSKDPAEQAAELKESAERSSEKVSCHKCQRSLKAESFRIVDYHADGTPRRHHICKKCDVWELRSVVLPYRQIVCRGCGSEAARTEGPPLAVFVHKHDGTKTRAVSHPSTAAPSLPHEWEELTPIHLAVCTECWPASGADQEDFGFREYK